MIRVVLGALSLSCVAAVTAPVAIAQSPGNGPDLCERAAQQDWFADDWSCDSAGDGLAIAAPGQVTILAGTLDDAVTKYEGFFGPTSAKMAVIGTSSLPDVAKKFLEDDGYLVLPWIDAGSRQQLVRASVERQVREQTQSLPEEQRAELLARAMSNLPAPEAGDNAEPSQTELGALAHEAGHLLFRHLYDNGQPPTDGQRRYGSSAPDWLDELAAVLNENEEVTSGRYTSARSRIAEGDDVLAYPFEQFLTMEHPSFKAAELLRERHKGGDNVAIALSGDEAREFLAQSGGDPVTFYSQARLLADFLLEKTGNPQVFLEIAMAYRAGQGFDEWLADAHAQHGLPASRDSFGAEWEEWIAGRLAQT